MNAAGRTAWNVEPLWRALSARLPGITIDVVARAGSTNTALIEQLRGPSGSFADSGFGRRAADLNACLLVAEQQTSGRGRMGREWVSEPGASLTFSLAVPLARADLSGLSLAVGVAVADALDPPAPGASARIGIKWPNDLWLAGTPGGRKLAGILIEAVAVGPVRFAVIGVGINVAPVAAAQGFDAAALTELDPAATAPATLATVMPALADTVLGFDAHGFGPFAAAFARRDLLRGRAISTTDASAPEGVADGVEPDGALRVRTAGGGLVALRSGEVSVRPVPGGAVPGGGTTPC